MQRREVELLYDVFTRYACPAELVGCPCCTSPEASARLVSRPLRELTAGELEPYVMKAMSTWGTEDDFKYFLPRLVELCERRELVYGIEGVLEKVEYGRFREWRAEEREAVRDYIRAAWEDAVGSMDASRADGLLYGASFLFDDLTPFLEYAETTEPGFRSAYRAENTDELWGKLDNAPWDEFSPAYRKVMDWLHRG